MFKGKEKKAIVLFLILLAGFILRFHGLREQSLWTDEFFTLFQATGHGYLHTFLSDPLRTAGLPLYRAGYFKAFLKFDPRKSIGDVYRGLSREDIHPPLYFCLMHFWMRLFSDDVFSLRGFSLLCGLLSIVLAHAIAKRLFGQGAAIFAAFFTALSPYAVIFSQEARPYAFLLVIGLSAGLLLLRLCEYGRGADLIIFSTLSCIGLFTHFFYLFNVAAQFVYLICFFRRGRIKALLALVAPLALFMLCFIPPSQKTTAMAVDECEGTPR